MSDRSGRLIEYAAGGDVWPTIDPSEYTAPVYTRPADWTALPTIASGSQGFNGLYAVWNNSTNYCAFTVTCVGGYTVDWGDGTSENVASGVSAYHQYTFADVDLPAATTRGYKCALIQVTRQNTGNNITAITLNVKHNATGVQDGYTTGWLDLVFRAPSLTSLTLGTSTASTANMEQFTWLGASALTSGASMFASYQRSLQSIILDSDFSALMQSMANMFSSCQSLTKLPTMSYASATNLASHASSCTSLVEVPSITAPLVTNVGSIFFGCTALKRLPALSFGSCGSNATFLFANCTSLKVIAGLSFVTCTSLDSMFLNCAALQAIPSFAQLSNSTITSLSSAFGGCYSVASFPAMSFGAVTTAASAFAGTGARSIGALSFTSCASLSQAFSTNARLVEGPVITGVSTCTTISSMFSVCTKLKSTPAYTFGNVAGNATSLFASCTSLVTVGALTFSGITSTASMFNTCSSLTSVPTFTNGLATVTNCGSMFEACGSLTSVPALTFGNVAGNATRLFYRCYSLKTVGVLTFGTLTDMGSMFYECWSLSSLSGITISAGSLSAMTSCFASCNCLEQLPALAVGAATTFTSAFSFLPALSRGRLDTPAQNISYQACNLGQAEIVDIFNGLAAGVVGKTVTVNSNPGYSLLTAPELLIATAKGWTVA
jgi:hypothetical protein